MLMVELPSEVRAGVGGLFSWASWEWMGLRGASRSERRDVRSSWRIAGAGGSMLGVRVCIGRS